MLPQSIVQNAILGSYNAAGHFVLDWEKACPILNLNFFYEEQLIKESEHYRQLLRPWEQVDSIDIRTITPTNFPAHTYFYSTYYLPVNDNTAPSYVTQTIYPGSMVGCVTWINDNPKLSIVNPLIGQYLYQDNGKTGEMIFSNDVTSPPIFRAFSLSGLKKQNLISLDSENQQLTCTEDSIIYKILDNTIWQYNIKPQITVPDNNPSSISVNSFILLNTDKVFCKVWYKNNCIDEPPVQVQVTLNQRIGKYEYSLVIPNHNYILNSDTQLEFY